MRIFTLGKNGIPLFFFALFLFSGTYSSYGQACPTVDSGDSIQYFCDSQEAEVGDLVVTTGTDVVWYADQNSTTVIPNNTFLVSGIYYAGTSTGNCQGTRAEVTVVVASEPEILGIKASTTPTTSANRKQSLTVIGVCVADVNNPDLFISDLRTNAENEDNVRWYYNRTDQTPIPEGTELQNNTDYFAAIYVPEVDCETNRRKTTVQFYSEPAPTGPANQEFCAIDNPTLGDIEASGDNRYFSTVTSQTELSPNTSLVNGRTYYVSAVGEDCESIERLAVTVTLTPENIIEETQRFCESIGEGNNFRQPEVQDLSPAGDWYADDTFTTPLDPNTELVEGEDYYQIGSAECEVFVVTAEFFPTPNAGSTTQTSFCQNGDPENLVDRINNSQLGAPDQTGSFSPSLSTGTNFFNPADYEPGSYTFRYTVEGNADCETDTSQITVTVLDAPNAGEDTALVFCQNEFEALALQILANPEQAEATFASLIGEDVDTYGDFTSDDLETIAAQYSQADKNIPFTAQSTYTVTNENGCTDTSVITLEVNPSPYAGENGSVEVSRDDAPFNLFTELEGSPQTGGAWTPGDTNGTFDPSTGESGVYTYTVTNTFGCTDSATVTVTVLEDCPVVNDTTQEFCASIGEGNNFRKPQVRDLMPADATWYSTADSETPLAATTVLEDGEDYFAGNANGTCPDRARVVVEILPTPNAGSTTSITVCSNDEPFDLIDRIRPSILGAPDRNGTFIPALASGGSIFDPSVDAARQYTYRVTSDVCPDDDSRITVNINQAPNAGADINETFCVADISEIVDTPQDFLDLYSDDNRTTGGTFTPLLEELAARFSNDPYDTFATVYSVTVNGCTDTANLSVTIDQEVPANAGGNVEHTLCSTDGIQNLEELLNSEAILGGTFSAPYEDGTFDPSTAGAEPIEITYTVGEDDACVTDSDSAIITINVIEGPDAGENGSITLNVNDDPVNLFDSLEGTPESGGTWTPGSQDGELDPSSLAPGNYPYTYTVVSDNDCTASAIVMVTIEGEIIECPEVIQTEQAFCESIESGNDSRLPRVSDLSPSNAVWYATADSDEALPSSTALVDGATYFAGNVNGTCENRESVTVTLDDSPNAGATTQETFCANGDPVDLLTVMNPSILGAPDAGGTFTPALASGTTVFDPALDAPGTYTYRVESTNDVCPADTAVITISLTEAPNAGTEVELSFCLSEGEQNLFDYLPDGVSDSGTFDGLTDGLFTPSETGEFTIEYSVAATGDCEGTSTADYIITVVDNPDAPTVSAFTGCVVDGATVADLDITGEDGATFNVWTNAELTEPAADTDMLTEANYYVTQTNEAGCVSEAATISVTLNDAGTPTLSAGGNVFCEFDGATIADLQENVTGTGTITWYASASGTQTVPQSTVLQNGTTYYATSTDATSGCESSQRLPVTVTLEVCEIVIPDAFSPNGDQVNDRFVVENLTSEYPNHNMEIYNRWGEAVFTGQAGENQGWDGTSTEGSFGSGVLPVGVYFYILYFNDGQTAPTQGRLYLSR